MAKVEEVIACPPPPEPMFKHM